MTVSIYTNLHFTLIHFYTIFTVPKMVFEYNFAFYANACHICKHFGNGVILKRCGNCAMISYCSKKHQRRHWPQHKDLCTAICSVVTNNMSSILSKNCSPETWVQVKMNFMLLVGIKIGRKLYHYEEQMFKFLRGCTVCHERDPKILKDCHNCPCASFCPKHRNDRSHADVCIPLQLCFNLDITIHNRRVSELKVLHWDKCVSLPNDMRDFLEHYLKSHDDLRISMRELAINSEYLTRPLTLLYAAKKLGYFFTDGDMILHMIAANMIDVDGIELWEILLHWLVNVTSIKIILIGPELTYGTIPIDLCDDCLLKNKQISIEIYGKLYEHYVSSTSFLKPHFIIGYNAGIHECNDFESEKYTWTLSLRAIAKQNCPFILTSYNMAEGKEEQSRVNAVLANEIKWTSYERNPYSSLRPHRDFETEGVYYQNQYITVYKHLNTF